MVNGKPKWAKGSNQYAKRPGVGQGHAESSRSLTAPAGSAQMGDHRLDEVGIVWDAFDVGRIRKSDVERSRHRFRVHLPEMIWNTAALEGNNFTLPEVRTLLEGVTVGGKRLEDERQILALSEAYNRLDEMVGSGEFELSKAVSDDLHGLLAVHEAIESGHFRGEGSVTGGGSVRLANGGYVEGTPHGEEGEALRQHFDDLVGFLGGVQDPRERSLLYVAAATRRQFYFDGNKRTARLMMAGELMSHGYDMVSVPYSRRLELNNALDRLFETDDATELLAFLGTCTIGH